MSKRIYILACTLFLASVMAAFGADVVKLKPLTAAYLDNKNTPLRYPEGVAITKNTVFVADTGNARLVRYTLVNDELKDGVEIKFEQLVYPIRLKATSKGDLLALDGKSRKILKINNAGQFQGYLDPQNVKMPDEFVPRSMAVDAKDNIYLLDIFGERVLVMDAAANVTRQIPFPKDFGYIADVAVDSKGNVLIIDSIRSQVLKAAPADPAFTAITKDLDTYQYFVVSIETDSQGRIYLLDQNDNGLVLLGQDGKFIGRYLNEGWKAAQLFYPGQGSLSESGIYAIADRNNNRVQLFKTQ